MSPVESQTTPGVGLAGYGHAVPDRVIANDLLETKLGLDPGWIEDRTGILERRWVGHGDTLSGLAAQAGQAALARATATHSITADAIGMLFLATSTPDHLLPPSAPLVAHKLGLKNCGAIDMAGACPGFLYALMSADAYVRAHRRPALVIAANILSRRINMAQRASAILFADAAGAVVLRPTKDADRGLIGADFRTDGTAYDLIKIAAGGSTQPFADTTLVSDTQMSMRDGKAVFVEAVEMMATTTAAACDGARLGSHDITHVIPHQANGRIVTAVAKRIGVDTAKVWESFAHYGNASAATIPLTLSLHAEARHLKRGDTLLMTAAGAGLNAGSIVWRV